MSDGVLILAGTPIGQVGDAPPRLAQALRTAQVIAAEDTRRLKRLLADLDVEPTGTVVSYFDGNEVALIVGEDGPNMSVRVVPGHELPDDVDEVPPAHEIAIAIAMRLLRDPDFHEEMLDWYYNQPDEEEEGD